MGDLRPASLFLAFLLTVAFILYVATIVSWLWMCWRLLTGRPLLPPTPLVARGRSPWGWQTIVVVFLVYIGVSLTITFAYAIVTRVYPHLTGDVRVAPKEPRPPAAGPAPGIANGQGAAAKGVPPEKAKEPPIFQMMVLNVIVQLALIATVPAAVLATPGARPRDFGLCFDDWETQVAVGVVATLIAAPVLYAIQGVASTIWKPSSHPLVSLFDDGLTPATGVLGFITAVVLAPMAEELLFRGVLLSWLATLLTSRAAVSPGTDSPTDDISAEGDAPVEFVPERDVDEEFDPGPKSPALEVSSAAMGTLGAMPMGAWLAVILSSFFFAYVHAPQWPAPIALFVLACVIGILFVRTGSLITAVAIHATFNGISTLMLFVAVMTGVKPGGGQKPVTAWIEPAPGWGAMSQRLTPNGGRPLDIGGHVLARNPLSRPWSR